MKEEEESFGSDGGGEGGREEGREGKKRRELFSVDAGILGHQRLLRDDKGVRKWHFNDFCQSDTVHQHLLLFSFSNTFKVIVFLPF